MIRTTVMADERTMERLRALARERGVPLSHVVREALEEKARQYRPKPRSLGIGSSGPNRVASTLATEPQPPAPWR
ncbi:MAG TPA: ribbon-helix-helix protein, CopG family [Actinomycetota bacterium]|nr:ribbon-helix-helix protein, CopG family [Actinomycetota bacterium]